MQIPARVLDVLNAQADTLWRVKEINPANGFTLMCRKREIVRLKFNGDASPL